MFHSVLKTHRQSHQAAQERINASRSAVLHSLEEISSHIVSNLNENILSLCEQQKSLEFESKKLLNQTTRFSKTIDKWQYQYQELNESIKELGDISNWSKELDDEMAAIAVSLSTVMAIKEHEKIEMKIENTTNNNNNVNNANSTIKK